MDNHRRNALLMILIGILLPVLAIVLGSFFDSSGESALGPVIISTFIGVILIVLGIFRLIKSGVKQ